MIDDIEAYWKLPGTKVFACIGTLTLAALLGAGVYAYVSHSRSKAQAQQAELQAAEHKGRADAAEAKAKAADERAGKAESVAVDAGQRVEQARAEVARLKRLLPQQTSANPVPSDPVADAPSGISGVSHDWSLVVAQDELIQAQDVQIKAQQVQIAELGTARDNWQQAFNEERQRAVQLQIALDAQKALNKGALWKGRVQGFVVGFGGGYVVGKR